MMHPTRLLLVVALCSLQNVVLALDPADVPAAAPRDAIMAAAGEMAEAADLAGSAFGWKGRQRPPFSFTYGGKSADKVEFLQGWQYSAEQKDLPGETRHHVAWTDPQTGLRVAADVVVYKRYPAADWVLHFENTGKKDTPILENIQALDLRMEAPPGDQPPVLHHLRGDDYSVQSFLPQESPLPAGGSIHLAPVGGRSSNGTFPFFNFEYPGHGGLFAAIGWTGQWAASFERDGERSIRLCAGMEHTHLVLHPGESIRSPRILLMGWRGDRLAAHNRFRRLMLFHYLPQQQSRPVAVPVFWQGYDRYNAHPTWPSEAGQRHAAEVAHQCGCDFLWLDAAWFQGNFPDGAGNWFCKPKEFPHGLKPVSDACHKLGVKFMVWFEPERVAAGTQIAKEHPEFVFGGAGGGLFKLNDPAARRWLTDLLIKRIGEYGMDWYRNDFNIDPLPFWRQSDAPDRQGMTEIRYVEGHYAMWDEMLARYPGLLIDNCASGGRRIDLETIRRSLPLWRSDTGCLTGHGDWHQAQAMGMNYYLPLHEICAWTPDAYEMRSTSGAGAIVQFGFLDKGYSPAAARQAVAEVKENQKYFYGDYYPLTGCSPEPDQFVAYQVHRADLGAGLVLAFRRSKSNVLGISVPLGGLKPEANYSVDYIDEQRQKTSKILSGRVLSTDLPLMIPQRGASLLVRYRQQ